MNWQLYRSLQLPHGDSAMYEEHLWNLLHGKGFRSYLDQGIFLGEHVQVIHLLLIPLYLLWPSQMLLELCDSALLAASCVPVYWIARRHSGRAASRRLAGCGVSALLPAAVSRHRHRFKDVSPQRAGDSVSVVCPGSARTPTVQDLLPVGGDRAQCPRGLRSRACSAWSLDCIRVLDAPPGCAGTVPQP